MKETTNVETGYLCHCLRVTQGRFEEILGEEPQPTYPLLKEKYGIGTMCSSCEYEAKGTLTEYLLLHPAKAGKGRRRSRGLRGDLRFAWKQIRERYFAKRPSKAPAGPKVYHTGIFFMRREGLESHLVVSNLRFPEHAQNANGGSAVFRATLFGDDGQQLAVSAPVTVPDGRSLELTSRELFPTVEGDFTGGLYVDYEDLLQTGSLRPYGVMVSVSPEFRARCHYHDKFGVSPDPGYFQNTAPFEPGQTCWMALSNCQPLAYETRACAKIGARVLTATLSVPPMASRWIRLPDLFPEAQALAAGGVPSLFYLENPQHVMVYFFWLSESAKTWMGQHH